LKGHLVSDVRTAAPLPANRTRTIAPDGLAVASLILAIAGFLPVPGALASLVAVVLGVLSGDTDPDGRRRRSGTARAGIILGLVAIGLLLIASTVYFGILGYPLPHIHRYRPS
jgi:hypothetical protein